MAGLDVRLAIARYLHQALGASQFAPPKLLQDMARDGLLGKKSGKAFIVGTNDLCTGLAALILNAGGYRS